MYNILEIITNMNYSFANKDVSISGKTVITDWKSVRIVSPENLQKRIKANEAAKKEIKKQKEVPTGANIFTTAESL